MSGITVTESRTETVGELQVRRALPTARRRTVGAWCFADHMGPADVTEERGIDVGPHPHIGLHTATWLLDGQVLHKDSLGSEQVVRAGQLNLMTAGHGIAHAEEATGHYRGELEGIQLWIAQPEATRHGESAFAHHAELPQFDLGAGTGTVIIGEAGGVASPARLDSELVGIDIELHGTTEVALRRDFEYAVIALRGAVEIDNVMVRPGSLAYLGSDRDSLPMRAHGPSRLLLLGGVPFESPILMWWNFVARSRDEIDEAFASWYTQDHRFAPVASRLPRIPVSAPFWQRG